VNERWPVSVGACVVRPRAVVAWVVSDRVKLKISMTE
jgi:hypothetical protein